MEAKEQVIAQAVAKGGEVLRVFRESKVIKASEFARAMGVANQQIYYYEHSKALCSRLIKAYLGAVEKINQLNN